MAYIAIETDIINVDKVVMGLGRIGEAAETAGTRASAGSKKSETSFKSLALQTAGLTMNTMQLVDIYDRLQKGQIDVARGVAFLAVNALQLTGNVWSLTHAHYAEISAMGAKVAAMAAHAAASVALFIVEKARAIAHFVANAVATMGIAVPVMLTAGAAAAGLYFGSQGMAEGGIVTSPTIALIGEKGPEAVIPLDKALKVPVSVTINIYESGNPRETARETADELRRRGIL